MRTKQIKLSKTRTVDAILSCGVEGIKIYMIPENESILLVKRKTKVELKRQDLGYNEVLRYTMVKYSSHPEQTTQAAFTVFIREGLLSE